MKITNPALEEVTIVGYKVYPETVLEHITGNKTFYPETVVIDIMVKGKSGMFTYDLIKGKDY